MLHASDYTTSRTSAANRMAAPEEDMAPLPGDKAGKEAFRLLDEQ